MYKITFRNLDFSGFRTFHPLSNLGFESLMCNSCFFKQLPVDMQQYYHEVD